jgi:hypothetical protein
LSLAAALRGSSATALPAALRCRGATTATLRSGRTTALPTTTLRQSSAGRCPAAREAATSTFRGSTAASAPLSLCIRLANEAQHENSRNECRRDTTP